VIITQADDRRSPVDNSDWQLHLDARSMVTAHVVAAAVYPTSARSQTQRRHSQQYYYPSKSKRRAQVERSENGADDAVVRP